jgi:hypothetical protein
VQRYLNIDTQEDSPTKKTVTWGNNTETSDSEFEENIFKKLKKVNQPEAKVHSNISLSFEEINNSVSNDNKIRELQSEVKTLHSKLDMIIELLKNS